MTPQTVGSKKKKSKAPKNPWSTPAMQQYRGFKEAHPECVLFFRMGDFYEMFDDDARTVSKAIGLTLTQRGNGIDMAGVPHHAAEGYMRRMVEQGFRVAVCEQLQDPAEAKGVVERGVTRIVTPGTLVDESLLIDSQTNLLCAMRCNDKIIHIAVAEISTGLFELHRVSVDRLDDALERLGIAEVIVGEDEETIISIIEHCGISLTKRPAWHFDATEGAALLKKQFGVTTLSGFGIEEGDPIVGVAGAILEYIGVTQASTDAFVHLRTPSLQESSDFVSLDATTIRSLEIEQTIRGNSSKGSLLWVMQRCKTAMGKRLLRRWLCEPLAQRRAIEQRQAIVEVFADDATLRLTIQQSLDQVQDIARIAGRVATGRVTPRDVVALGTSLFGCDEIANKLTGDALKCISEELTSLATKLKPLADVITSQCLESPPTHMRDGGLFVDGFDAALDEARTLQRDAGQWLSKYQSQIVEETKISTLKVGYNRVFGYYIEVSRAQAERVPDNFTRKQTLKNAERYITPELKTFENRVLSAESMALEREQQLFRELCHSINGCIHHIIAFADVIARLDTLACFADVAMLYGYVRPSIVDEPILEIQDGRHPVLDRLLQDRFVPNDCVLNESPLALITGPNMAGKSTYIRQVAIITLLAHTGSFVPAKSATIGLVDRIFTRVGANDELHAGQSTFMVEMVETANILNNATRNSLVILDEIGRGTSTLDGLSLAWAIAESLSDVGCRTLFATHYHELTTLADRDTNITNLHVTVREWNDDIVFLYRIAQGRADRSYGIHVAKIAGVPKNVVDRANEVLNTLTVHNAQASDEATSHISAEPQMGLFTEYLPSPLVEELKQIDINALSPMEAFELLREFNRRASGEDER
jgi:DNA mismatch repair protein MutS